MLYRTLNEIKHFIENEIQNNNYLMAQNNIDSEYQDESEKMVLPKVCTGLLPHQNFNLYGADNMFFQAPYVLIGFDEASFDMDTSEIPILIQVCCCSSSHYEEEGQRTLPDNRSFEDCIIFLEWIKNRIQKKWTFNGVPINGKFRLNTYNGKELTYPFCFGYLSFSLEAKPEESNIRDIY